MKSEPEGMLSPYRVLDLTDEKGWLCGKLLGDLGADVIKIEKPGGDPDRSIGPFFRDELNRERSLYWFSYNANKRGITLDIETVEGQGIFKKLVKASDFIIESFPPGYLEKIELGYDALDKIKPGVIFASITPFGQSGPYSEYKTSDIVSWALGAHMNQQGDADRPPVRVSRYPQSYLHAGAEASAAALMALYYRRMTGEGQRVDISIQECVARINLTSSWDQNKILFQRGGSRVNAVGNTIRPYLVWPCKDGHVIWMYWGGPMSSILIPQLLKWMKDEGMLDEYLAKFDWMAFDFDKTNQEVLDRMAEPTIKFFKTHTKAELFEGAIKRRIFLYPVNNTKDITESEQLAARDFWVKIEHPELRESITYPGPFVKSSEAPLIIRRHAPLIGEHNNEIYEQELGISRKQLLILQQAKVI